MNLNTVPKKSAESAQNWLLHYMIYVISVHDSKSVPNNNFIV